jgi:hypothetical protein
MQPELGEEIIKTLIKKLSQLRHSAFQLRSAGRHEIIE